jgi:uncharacterized protein
MATQIFVNLPVKDLNRSIEFFSSLGYRFNPIFTDENATCMIIGENIHVMLLVEKRFSDFTTKPVADAKRTTESIICISAESKEEVDTLVNKAVAAGAATPNPKQDYGFMYGWGYEDLDGHLWEVMWMDVNSIPEEMKRKAQVTEVTELT